ncbi:putative F-box/LRR-repeat protein 9 [Aegilops tauschii subsp. strangulata]|uniref:Uncharacterized protein n=1 Tax=Aegilops tauschii TaxID=37682 RepID=N1QZN3_AEGTA|nr:putative F-box/LRR-repeat protein 23 [Aegilops tauschii subsp. strangulata]
MATPSPSSSLLLEGRPPGLWPPPEWKKKTKPQAVTRDWADLPRDALLLVLEKLHQVDVLRGPELVCRPWHLAARDEPSLWRRIDLRLSHLPDPSSVWRFHEMGCAAVRRSRGSCEAVYSEGAIDEEAIPLLVESAHLLKSLRLINCIWINDRICYNISHLVMLEELEISNCGVRKFSSTCFAVGYSCPHLKRFRLSSSCFIKRPVWGAVDCEVEGITRMRGLRSLQLFAQTISTTGLAAILDSCVQLDSLDIRHCFHVEMGDELMSRCSKFEILRLPHDSTDDYDLEFSAPDMSTESPRPRRMRNYGDEGGAFLEDVY